MSLSYNMRTLINRRGQQASLQKRPDTVYNTTTGTNTNVFTFPYTIMAYFAEFDFGEEINSNVGLGGRQVLIGPLDTSGVAIPEPENGDKISGVGDTVVVQRVQSLYNSGTLVCYICRVSE